MLVSKTEKKQKAAGLNLPPFFFRYLVIKSSRYYWQRQFHFSGN
jgi:hypothetical protein